MVDINRRWTWFCEHCEMRLERGQDAVACEDASECPYSGDWGGDVCGFVVCRYCHRPATEVTEGQLEGDRS